MSMSEIEANYHEQFLLPPSIEDWIPRDHPVRFIREIVGQMDLKKLGFRLPQNEVGRPAYSPRLLLRVWLYGYWKKRLSSRKLEEACREDMGFIWLCGGHVPDHNTLWRFFKTNRKALRKVFKTTVRTALQMEMLDFTLQALDGTKIAGACSQHGRYDREHLEKRLSAMDQIITDLEKQIEKQNHRKSREKSSLPHELQNAQALRDRVRTAMEIIDADQTRHCHPTDPEARRMGGKPREFGYNAQAVENTGCAPEVLVADAGYADAGQLAQVEEEGIEVLVALPNEKRNPKDWKYHRRHFKYDAANDVYICPVGREIPFRRIRVKNQRTRHTVRVYRGGVVCQGCLVRDQCTKDRHGRSIERAEGEDARERMRKRLEKPENQKKLRCRGQVVELFFARVEWLFGFRRWTMHGLPNVSTQWAMICTVWNLMQMYRVWKG